MASKNYIKGLLSDIVLHVINEHGEMYGYALTKKVAALSQGSINITEGALYPILHQLEQDQKLTATFREYNGRLRKYYHITPQGGKAAKVANQNIADFVAGLAGLFNLYPKQG